MLNLPFDQLRLIGLNQTLLQRLPPAADDDHLLRVCAAHRETMHLHDGATQRSARLLPRLQRALADSGTSLAVGDWVLAAPDSHDAWWVHTRVPPLNALSRRDDHGATQAIVSNVDTALLVMGLDGDFNPRRLERYLALVHGAGIGAVIVLTKADLCADAPGHEAQLTARLPARVPVLTVDATAATTAAALAPYLGTGQTLVLLGSSGAGKSTLTNTLAGVCVQATGAVRADDSRGRHTTTARTLVALPQGGCVIDTPGLRGLAPALDADAIAASFDDVTLLAAQCRFRDCTHGDEPGCAVRAALDPDRLRNFHKLQREARRDGMTWLERQQQLAQWKARSRGAAARMKLKRGR
jgi:ribosome biogenesis GTPase